MIRQNWPRPQGALAGIHDFDNLWRRQALVIDRIQDAIADNATVVTSGSPPTTGQGGIVPVSLGGTGLATHGTADQVLGVTHDGTALIYKSILAGAGLSAVAADGTITLSMPSVGSPGTYGDGTHVAQITTDSQGRVTAASSVPITHQGDVTSVGLSLPSLFTVSGSPVTSNGTLTATLASQSANTVFAGPSSGAAAAPTFRAIAAADLGTGTADSTKYLRGDLTWQTAATSLPPSGSAGGDLGGSYPNPSVTALRGHTVKNAAPTNAQVLVWNGTNLDWEPVSFGTDATITNAGAVTVASSHSNSFPSGATVLGDIWYGSGTSVLSALAGNTSSTRNFLRQTGTGSASAAPAWDTLVAGDIPSLDASKITSGTLATARLGSGTASPSTFLRGDQTWASATAVPAGSNTQVQFNSSGAFGADSGFTYATPGQITLTPTSTSAVGVAVSAPASFQGSFLNGTDSSGHTNAQISQLSGGQTQLLLFSRTSTAVPGLITAGPASYQSSGGNLFVLTGGEFQTPSFAATGKIAFQAAENHSGSNLGTDILFQTTAVAANTPTSRVKFSANGNVLLNASGSAISTSATDGGAYLPNMAGSPSGTPTSYTGATPLVYDTTNNVLWGYQGSQWANLSSRYNLRSLANVSATLGATDDIVLYAFNNVSGTPSNTFTLTSNSADTGREVTVLRKADDTGNGTLTVSCGAGIDNGTTATIAIGHAKKFVFNGTKWYTTASF